MDNVPTPPGPAAGRPPDWDVNSPELIANLRRVEQRVREDAKRPLSELGAALALHWQAETMRGLHTDDPQFVGRFRGSSDDTNRNVRVGHRRGTLFARVNEELEAFDAALRARIGLLDEAYRGASEKL